MASLLLCYGALGLACASFYYHLPLLGYGHFALSAAVWTGQMVRGWRS
ncbi:hypothetical protein [Actinomadura kijaniata]|nr:hypothetical protein [Actinomadura kijaniata]